jgi:hypothetical protein
MGYFDRSEKDVKDFKDKVDDLERKFKSLSIQTAEKEIQCIYDRLSKVEKGVSDAFSGIPIPYPEHVEKSNELRSILEETWSKLNSIRKEILSRKALGVEGKK